jgi:hypothetical protein
MNIFCKWINNICSTIKFVLYFNLKKFLFYLPKNIYLANELTIYFYNWVGFFLLFLFKNYFIIRCNSIGKYLYNIFFTIEFDLVFFFLKEILLSHLSNEIYLANESTIFSSQLSSLFSLIFLKKNFN